MPDVEFGREFGAGVVDASGDPAAGWRFQFALARGSTEWLSITLADGTLASDGVLALDAEGLLPVAFASIPGDDVPGELWAHRVGAPLTEGWYRVRLPGDGITTSGGGQDGEDGTDGKDGMTILRFRWEAGDNPRLLRPDPPVHRAVGRQHQATSVSHPGHREHFRHPRQGDALGQQRRRHRRRRTHGHDGINCDGGHSG